MATDAEGRPVRFLLTGGQTHDVTHALACVPGWESSQVMADKGDDRQAFVGALQASGTMAVMPPRSNRKNPRMSDTEVYKQRHRIERCFHRLKPFRRLATRDDRKASYCLACIHLAAASLWR